jgi:hypothetical protein
MTITAKNYAAQAEAALRKNPRTLYCSDLTRERKNACVFADGIKNAAHFAIPDGGKILDDGLKGLTGIELHLPYPAITIEFFYRQDSHNFKFVIYAEEQNGLITVLATCLNTKGDRWVLFKSCVKMLIDTDLDSVAGGMPFAITSDKGIPDDEKEAETFFWRGIVNSFCEFLEALSCKNITTATHQKEDKVHNYRRIKKGKLPFYETKILVIDTKEKLASQQQTRTGTHASPRQHLRRGHIRRLPSGNYWVNSCVVGDAEKGTIHKQYAVL